MDNYRKETMSLLKFAFSTLENLNDEQCEKILKGEAVLKYAENTTPISSKKDNELKEKKNKKITKSDTSKKSKTTNAKEISLKEKAEKISLDLILINDRTIAYSLLNKRNITKDMLFYIAKKFNVHVLRNDNKSKLVAKIVESVVGTKLDIEAISQTNIGKKI